MADSRTLQERLERLSPARRELLAQQLGVVASVPASNPRLAVCVAVRDGAEIDDDEVRAFARQRLPDYMVPQVITFVEQLPRTGAGKINRRALNALEAAPAATGAGDFVPPQTEAEKTLASIWCEVLGLEDVGTNDDFFEVGGDSLLSIRILSRASKAGLSLEPEAFFSHPTIAAQAALAEPPAVAPEPDKDKAADETLARKDPLVNLDRGELDGLSRMLDDLDSDG